MWCPWCVLAGLADWLFHLDVFVRMALLVRDWSAVALWVGFTLVLASALRPVCDLDIALRIEQRWPGLNDRLASTIQFLRLNPADDRYGSPALREATVRQAIEETRSIDFREVIEHQARDPSGGPGRRRRVVLAARVRLCDSRIRRDLP